MAKGKILVGTWYASVFIGQGKTTSKGLVGKGWRHDLPEGVRGSVTYRWR